MAYYEPEKIDGMKIFRTDIPGECYAYYPENDYPDYRRQPEIHCGPDVDAGIYAAKVRQKFIERVDYDRQSRL